MEITFKYISIIVGFQCMKQFIIFEIHTPSICFITVTLVNKNNLCIVRLIS